MTARMPNYGIHAHSLVEIATNMSEAVGYVVTLLYAVQSWCAMCVMLRVRAGDQHIC